MAEYDVAGLAVRNGSGSVKPALQAMMHQGPSFHQYMDLQRQFRSLF